jgi:hypothetical protein
MICIGRDKKRIKLAGVLQNSLHCDGRTHHFVKLALDG